jgi:hypothetical protein
MLKFEIFEKRDPKTVTDTVDCDDMRAFRTYWFQQCNTAEFDYRQIDAPPAPEFQHRVLKISLTTGEPPEPLPLINQMLDTIAQYNGVMSVAEIHAALMGGKTVYTNYDRYVLE